MLVYIRIGLSTTANQLFCALLGRRFCLAMCSRTLNYGCKAVYASTACYSPFLASSTVCGCLFVHVHVHVQMDSVMVICNLCILKEIINWD